MRDAAPTRQHILEATAQLLVSNASESIRLADVSKSANVALQTIYYHFGSKERLIAQAQQFVYARISAANIRQLHLVEAAVDERNEGAFWEALANLLDIAWSQLPVDETLGVVQVLLDVWSDKTTRREYLDVVDERYARWLGAMTRAKDIGWIAAEVDIEVPLAVFWSATFGQSFIASRTRHPISSERVSDYFLRSIRGNGSD